MSQSSSDSLFLRISVEFMLILDGDVHTFFKLFAHIKKKGRGSNNNESDYYY